jgi:hypothetical protein
MTAKFGALKYNCMYNYTCTGLRHLTMGLDTQDQLQCQNWIPMPG